MKDVVDKFTDMPFDLNFNTIFSFILHLFHYTDQFTIDN